MAYISTRQNNKTVILNSHAKKGVEANVGEFLLSFLELDLREYGKLYHYVTSHCPIHDKIKNLSELYPKTAEKFGITYDEDYDNQGNLLNIFHFLSKNQDIHFDFYDHPFFAFSNIGFESSLIARSFDDTIMNIGDALDLAGLQEKFKNYIDFCFLEDNDKINMLTPEERFFLFFSLDSLGIVNPPSIRTTYLFHPFDLHEELKHVRIPLEIPKSREDQRKVIDQFISPTLDLITDEMISKIHGKVTIDSVAKCIYPEDFLSYEFDQLIRQNIQIKICQNCKRLFIPSGKYNTDCCDRIPEGEKYSCKKIMAQKRRKQKVNSDPITKEYEKAYKRMYARISSGTLEKSDFLKWSEEAKQKRDATSRRYAESKDEAILIDFKKYLGNK